MAKNKSDLIEVKKFADHQVIIQPNPLRTVLMPDDLAGAYVFLASRRNARGITGSIVTVDAGAMLRMPRRTERAN